MKIWLRAIRQQQAQFQNTHDYKTRTQICSSLDPGKPMEMSDAIMIARDLMMTSLLLVAPVVIVSLVVGLFISIVQTVTSVQEQTLSFAPRIVAVVGLTILLTPWYLATLKNYTTEMFEYINQIL